MKYFQLEVSTWMNKCFRRSIVISPVERNHRFLEEALELVQSIGYSKEGALAMVEYVFERPKGEVVQEVGGVMVTLAALCSVQGLNIQYSAEKELERVNRNSAQIRKKQSQKQLVDKNA